MALLILFTVVLVVVAVAKIMRSHELATKLNGDDADFVTPSEIKTQAVLYVVFGVVFWQRPACLAAARINMSDCTVHSKNESFSVAPCRHCHKCCSPSCLHDIPIYWIERQPRSYL